MRRLLFMMGVLAAPSVAGAKDLRQRIGVGFDTQLGQLSALSARFGLPTSDPAINVQVGLQAGFASSSANGATNAVFGGGKLMYGVVAEDNMNLYVSAGAGALNDGTSTTARLQPGMAVDFFLFGLENLGFTTGWGINLDLGQASGVSTTAAVGAGVHYWF